MARRRRGRDDEEEWADSEALWEEGSEAQEADLTPDDDMWEADPVVSQAPLGPSLRRIDVVAALPAAERVALALALGLGRADAADEAVLARALARPGALGASLDRLDEDARTLLLEIAWRWGSVPALAAVTTRLLQYLRLSEERVDACLGALRKEALVGQWGDRLVVPREVLAALTPTVLARMARDAIDATPLGRAPQAIVADVARLVGRLRLGARLTAQGRLTKREQGGLMPLVEAVERAGLALSARIWVEYDDRLALPLALAAMLSMLRVNAAERTVATGPEGERWLGLDGWTQWTLLVDAWEALLALDPRVARASPRALATMPRGRWLGLADMLRLAPPRPALGFGDDGRDDMLLYVVTGYRLGALEVAVDGAGGPVAVRPSAALRAWATGAPAESAFASEGRATVSGAGEVVVPGALDARDWAELTAFCEVVSLDRATVLRPTRASIGAAVADGRSAEAIVECLERLSGGRLPQAVAFQVRDWGRRRGVTMRVAVLVEASDEGAAEALERVAGRGGLGLTPLGAGLWQGPPERAEATRTALQAAGVAITGDRLTGPLPIAGRHARTRMFSMPWPGPFEGVERLTPRVATGRRPLER